MTGRTSSDETGMAEAVRTLRDTPLLTASMGHAMARILSHGPTFVWTGITLAALTLLMTPLAHAAPLTTQMAIAAPLLAIMGLPHGGMDLPLGMMVFRRWSRRWGTLAFLVAYLAVAGAVIALWTISSGTALILFLALAIWHFGSEDCEAHGLALTPDRILLFGLTPLLAAHWAWPEDVARLFAWMALDGVMAAETLTLWGGRFMGALWLAAAMVFAVRQGLRPESDPVVRIVADLTVTAAVFLLLPPLLAFTVYFVLIHSPRHMRGVHAWLQARPDIAMTRFYALSLVAAGVVTSLGLAIAAIWAIHSGMPLIDPAILTPIVFIGLSALTVPHMLLNALAARVLPA